MTDVVAQCLVAPAYHWHRDCSPWTQTEDRLQNRSWNPSAHEHVKYWTPELVVTARLQKRFYGANKKYLDATEVGMCAVMIAEYALEHLQQPPSVPVVASINIQY